MLTALTQVLRFYESEDIVHGYIFGTLSRILCNTVSLRFVAVYCKEISLNIGHYRKFSIFGQNEVQVKMFLHGNVADTVTARLTPGELK